MKFETLSDDDINRIHEGTLQILEKTGVWFSECPEAINIMEENGCQIDGTRVMIPRTVVEECLNQLPDRENIVYHRNNVFGAKRDMSLAKGQQHFGLMCSAYEIYEYATKSTRDVEEDDRYELELLLDSLPNFSFNHCEMITRDPNRVGKTRWDLDTVDGCIEFLRYRVKSVPPDVEPDNLLCVGGLVYREDAARLDILRHMILEGVETIEKIAPLRSFTWINPISPLQYHPDQIDDMITRGRRDGSDCLILISPAILMGATGPVTRAGTLVQHNAEVLGATVLAQLIHPGMPVVYGVVSTVMDLQVGDVSFGNLETSLLISALVQMADHYNMPSRIAPGNTSAKAPGARAATETAVGLFMGIMSGANLVCTGLLNSILMVSYEHLVVTNELINQLRSVAKGITVDDEHLALDLINQEGHPSSEFIYADHTVAFMKESVYYSDYCGRVEHSHVDWYERAHGQVKELFECVEKKKLMEYMNKRLAAVETRLREDDKTWRGGSDSWSLKKNSFRLAPEGGGKGEPWWEFYVQDLDG